METPFCLCVFWGVIFKKIYFRKKTAESRKTLAEWPVWSTKIQLSLTKITTRRLQSRALQSFFGSNFAPDFVFFPVDRNQRQGPTGA